MKSQYIIILTVIITLVASMLFLAQIEQNQRDKNQNFWSIYFIAPLTQTDNRFVIDNKTQNDATFHYEIIKDNDVKKSENIEIKKDKRKLVDTKDYNNQSIKIIVTNGKDKKEIEKK